MAVKKPLKLAVKREGDVIAQVVEHTMKYMVGNFVWLNVNYSRVVRVVRSLQRAADQRQQNGEEWQQMRRICCSNRQH